MLRTMYAALLKQKSQLPQSGNTALWLDQQLTKYGTSWPSFPNKINRRSVRSMQSDAHDHVPGEVHERANDRDRQNS